MRPPLNSSISFHFKRRKQKSKPKRRHLPQLGQSEREREGGAVINFLWNHAIDFYRATVERWTLAVAVTATTSDELKEGSGESLRAAAVRKCEPALSADIIRSRIQSEWEWLTVVWKMESCIYFSNNKNLKAYYLLTDQYKIDGTDIINSIKKG